MTDEKVNPRVKLSSDLAKFCDDNLKDVYESKIFVFDMYNVIDHKSEALFNILKEYYGD